LDEIDILKQLTRNNKMNHPVIKLRGNFVVKKNGRKHCCMLFDRHGDNLYEFIKYVHQNGNKRIPLNIIKKVVKQLLDGIRFIHKNQIIHTDIKSENILLRRKITDINIDKFNEDDFQIVIADFGTACWFDDQFSDYVQTMEMRAPECILGGKYNHKIDIWSTACTVFELLTHCSLFSLSSNPNIHITNSFDTDHKTSNGHSEEKNYYYGGDDLMVFVHLFKIQSMLGPLPLDKYKFMTKRDDFYTDTGFLRFFHPNTIGSRSLRTILNKDYKYGKKNAKKLEEFIMPMLDLIPSKRATAYDMLQHEWFK